ncbi:hypothetical protein D3C71_1883440 [compost metagenome]
MLSQQWNILPPLAQGRQSHGGHVEPVIKIFTKAAFADGIRQIHMGSGHDADVHFYRPMGAHPGHFPFLQYTQQLYL